MANTITLSSDMNTIYIIDSNNDVIFSQSLSGYGAVIFLNGSNQLTGQAATADLTGAPVIKSVAGWQWTSAYNSSSKTLSFIGIDDLIGSVDGVNFTIDRTNGVQIKRSGTNLVLISGLV